MFGRGPTLQVGGADTEPTKGPTSPPPGFIHFDEAADRTRFHVFTPIDCIESSTTQEKRVRRLLPCPPSSSLQQRL